MQSESPSPLVHLQTATAHLRGLLASEWRLACAEMSKNLRAARTGLVLAAVGFAAALSGVFAMTAALFLGISALSVAPWLSALATGLIISIIAALLLWIGVSRLSPKALAPTQTTQHAQKTLRLVTEKTYVSRYD